MPVDRCRVCNHPFFPDPLTVLRDMPRAAQYLPGPQELAADRGVDLVVAQCAGCGLIQLTNDPVPYFREVVRAAGISAEVASMRALDFQDFVERFGLANKNVLEVGCGGGEFLSLLSRCPVDAYGIEASQRLVQKCVAEGLKARCDYVEHEASRLEDGPFDAFLLLMFLEHFPNPNASLRGLRANLADGAMGMIEVPNTDMILRDLVFSEFIGDHLLYFTRQTLEQTLAFNGFEVVETTVVRNDYVLRAIVRARSRLDVSAFDGARMSLQEQLDAFLALFPRHSVAVWGAGHQALAVLSLTGIADRVRYVIDSAPFKQGRFSPATHVPIVAPDALLTEPVEAIVVMAASYSDEVVSIIRQKYGTRLPIAVLRPRGLEQLPPPFAED